MDRQRGTPELHNNFVEANMSFRFLRRITLFPGVTLNLSKSGGSLSFGPRGAKFTIGPRGPRASVGLPGTGIFYTTTFSKSRSGKKASPAVGSADRLTLGFFKRLITPDDEEALVDGCRELVLGNEEAALAHLRNAAHLADGAFLAGSLALKLGHVAEAADYLNTAVQQQHTLGEHITQYGIAATLSLPITEEVTAHVGPDMRGVLLTLAEAYQEQERWQEALDCLEQLRQLNPEDVVIRLSLVELLTEARPGDRDAAQEVIELAEGIGNESPVHTALLLYKARALRALGLFAAAAEVLSAAHSRKKGRSDELLHALRYQRALTYLDTGQERRAQAELQKLYAEDPQYEDVAIRLGLS
jgi:tetratricopeptide (TPR) repeat protein